MPPRNAVPSLYDLTFKSTSKLVNNSCERINSAFIKTPYDIDADAECMKSVLEMQTHLLRYIHPPIWDSLLQAVMHIQVEAQKFHEIILYSTFMTTEVKIRKLKIGYERREMGDVTSILKKRHFENWLLLHPELFCNIVEVDVSNAPFEIIPFICNYCVNLEVVTLPRKTKSDIYEVLRSCTKLRKMLLGEPLPKTTNVSVNFGGDLEYAPDLTYDADIFLSVPTGVNLKLKTLSLVNISPENIKQAMNHCPHLVDLHISHSDIQGPIADLFEILSTSQQKLRKLALINFDISEEPCRKFFSSKGIYLTELEVLLCEVDNILDAVQYLSLSCKNLKQFKIVLDLDLEEQVDRLTLTHEMLFPKLEHLDIVNWVFGDQGIVLAHHCLSNAPMLTSFSLEMLDDYNAMTDDAVEPAIETARLHALLLQLFSNERVEHLRSLHLSCSYLIVSVTLARKIYEKSDRMTILKVERISKEAKFFLRRKCRKAILRNLDFKCLMRESSDSERFTYILNDS